MSNDISGTSSLNAYVLQHPWCFPLSELISDVQYIWKPSILVIPLKIPWFELTKICFFDLTFEPESRFFEATRTALSLFCLAMITHISHKILAWMLRGLNSQHFCQKLLRWKNTGAFFLSEPFEIRSRQTLFLWRYFLIFLDFLC